MSMEQVNRREQLVGVGDLSTLTQRALSPVAPPPEFRTRLRDGLKMAAHHREAHELEVEPRTSTPWVLLVGVVLGSVVGLIAIVLRVRHGARPAE